MGWAHASGWAQLQGTRHSISCVLPAHNHLSVMRDLLPLLSDRLTECGYPWEVIVVDAASTDGTEGVLSAWCELPGYRLIAIEDSVGRAGAIVIGLEAARGDAVVLLDAITDHPLSLIGEMVRQWEDGATVVYAQRGGGADAVAAGVAGANANAAPGTSVLRTPGHGPFGSPHAQAAALPVADDRGDLMLLDRAVVRDLLR